MNSTDYGNFNVSKKVKTVRKKVTGGEGAFDITSHEQEAVNRMNSYPVQD